MKRLNPNTGNPFKRGDAREDGKVFYSYNTKYVTRNGFFKERWSSLEQIAEYAQQTQAWHQQNPERMRALRMVWVAKNKERKPLLDKQWAERNRARSNAHKQRWNKNNAGVVRALNRKRFAAQIQRTPKWLDAVDHAEMEFTYIWCNALRSCGLDYHVDHIVPLQGKIVSGLHVPWNLQVIPAIENIRKGNRLEVNNA